MAEHSGRGAPPPWDPFGLWRQMMPAAAEVARPLAAQAAQAGALSMVGARTALQGLLEAARSRLVGRRLTVGPPDRPVVLTLTEVDVPADPVLLAAGQTDRATLVAEDVEWGEYRFPSASAVLHNVHTRPGGRPVLVAAPVDIIVTVPGERVTELVARRAPWLALEITADGSMRVRLNRHPDWGWVEVAPSAAGNRVLLRPTGASARQRAWSFSRQLPPVHFPLDLADGVRIVALEPRPAALEVRLRVDEWRADYLESLSFAKKPR